MKSTIPQLKGGTILQRLTAPKITIQKEYHRLQARLLAVMSLILLLTTIAVVIIQILLPSGDQLWFSGIVVSGVIMIITYWFSRTHYYQIGAVTLTLYLSVFIHLHAWQNTLFYPFYLTIVPLLLSGVFLSLSYMIGLTCLNVGATLIILLMTPQLSVGLLVWPITLMILTPIIMSAFIYHRDQLEQLRQTDLRDSEARFRALYQRAPVMIHTMDKDGILLDVNETWLTHLEYQADEVIGKPLENFMADTYRDYFWQVSVPAFWQYGALYDLSYEFVKKSGETIEVLLSVVAYHNKHKQFQYALGVMQDITERRQAETAQTQLLEILEATSDIVGMADLDSNFLYMNQAGRKILGLNPEEPLNHMSAYSFYPEETAQLIQQEGVPTAIREGIWSSDEISLMTRNGRLIPTSMVLVAHRGVDGHVERFSAVARDITDLRDSQAALKAYSEHLQDLVATRTQQLEVAQEQLTRQEKLAFLGQLAGGVGHELRNPLGVIANAVYYLKLVQIDADETVKEYLNIIDGRVQESQKIVTDLLGLSRNRIVERETISIDKIVTEVLNRHPAPAQIVVTTDIPSNLPPIWVDASQIRQVVTNLVTNAYQAMSEEGHLQIAAELTNNNITLQIKDNGTGMSPEVLARIFEPLFTTKSQGIGLGLAVSKNLIEVNGGQIEVVSEIGQGTCFTLTLPIQ